MNAITNAGIITAASQQWMSRPIETVWDAVTAVTAFARNIEHQDVRVQLERTAGAMLDLVA